MQVEMFNTDKSLEHKRHGMIASKNKSRDNLDMVRRIAVSLARENQNGECDANALAKYAWRERGIDVSGLLGNACGSIFSSSIWEYTGKWNKSERIRSHGRPVRVWRLRDV